MKDSVVFSRLMDEYGNLEQEKERDSTKAVKSDSVEEQIKPGDKKVGAALMSVEERETGAVTWSVYARYLRYAGGLVWAPVIILLLTLAQGAQGIFRVLSLLRNIPLTIYVVGNNLFLGFWTSSTIHGFHQGDYMAVYAALGVASAIFSFFLSFSFA